MRTLRATPRLLALAALLTLAACSAAPRSAALLDQTFATQAATVPAGILNLKALIIVRHGDVDPVMKSRLGNATPLLPRGDQRAKELAAALKDAGITRIIVSPALRTEETAAVLAKELGITPEIPFAPGQPLPAALKDKPAATIIDYLAATGKPGDSVLVVYHHSEIPGMLEQLGYAHEPGMAESEYDRAYVILPDAAKAACRLLRLRFGGRPARALKAITGPDFIGFTLTRLRLRHIFLL